MPATKTTKETKSANTVEISRKLAHLETFDSRIFTDNGYKIKSLRVIGDNTLSIMKTENVTVDKSDPDFKIDFSDINRRRYGGKGLTIDKKFNKRCKSLLKFDKNACWSINYITVSKGNDEFIFKIVGSKANGKQVMLVDINGAPHHVFEHREIIEKVGDLMEDVCYYQSGVNKAPVVCSKSD